VTVASGTVCSVNFGPSHFHHEKVATQEASFGFSVVTCRDANDGDFRSKWCGSLDSESQRTGL